MTHNYDGRLDPVAATGAVMKLLTRYYDTWHDWRLAGMAYNTGEYRLRAILKKHGKPPAKPVIPKLPVGRITRQHLTRVLAIACIIRDPHRFHVTLPRLAPQRRLEVVQLKAPISFTQVAKVSGVSRGWLRRVNAGYRRARVTAGTPMQLLLPAPAARALRGAIASGDINDASGPASPASQGSYTVVRGDSLSRIAQRFHVSVAELRRWNQLKNSLLHPGQVLHLAPPSR
jgi:membrane-bound lytic murein transglycosylase D